MLVAVHQSLQSKSHCFGSPRMSVASDNSVLSLGEELKALRENWNAMGSSSDDAAANGVAHGASDSDLAELQLQAADAGNPQSCKEKTVRTCRQCRKSWEDTQEDGGIIERCECGAALVDSSQADNGAAAASDSGVPSVSTGNVPAGMGHGPINNGVIGKRKKTVKASFHNSSRHGSDSSGSGLTVRQTPTGLSEQMTSWVSGVFSAEPDDRTEKDWGWTH